MELFLHAKWRKAAVLHEMFISRPARAAEPEQTLIKQGGEQTRARCVCAVDDRLREAFGSRRLLRQCLLPFSLCSALCPPSDTNINIISTRGGNSFISWMIKIFLKSMLMTSCAMGSKHNYCCCCKCFLFLYFCCTGHNWIGFFGRGRLLIACRAVIYHRATAHSHAKLFWYSEHRLTAFFLICFSLCDRTGSG